MPDQLVFPFGVTSHLARADFIQAPCNEQALRFVERWPDWPARVAAVFGPAQSGKTHLAEIWCAQSGARRVSAADLKTLSVADLTGEAPLVLELGDTQGRDLERDRILFALFERPRGFSLLTAQAHPSEWAVGLADLKSRLDSLISFPLWAPDDALLTALMRKHFADRQLAVSEAAAKRLLLRVERTPGAIAALIARADTKALAEKRAVTERLILDLLES